MKKASAQFGFTLIEMSITLIMIGLFVAGILVGKDLIHAAEIRKLLGQREQFETATNTFRTKYNCLPGDCASAAKYGIGTATGSYGESGDGDGSIDYPSVPEPINFWYHLYKSGLIEWTPDPSGVYGGMGDACNNYGFIASPCLPFKASTAYNGLKGGWWILAGLSTQCSMPSTYYTVSRGHYWWLTAVVSAGGGEASAILIPADAYAVDIKIDDGEPFSGIALAAGDSNGDPCGASDAIDAIGGRTNDACVDNRTTPNRYNIQNTNRTQNNLCSMLIRTGF